LLKEDIFDNIVNMDKKLNGTSLATTTDVQTSLKRHGRPRKMTPKILKVVFQMTLSGYTDEEIIEEVKNKWGITVAKNTIYYHRLKNKDLFYICEKEQIQIAAVRSPYMQLATRVASMQRAIEKELAKKRPSAQGLSMLYTAMETAIKNAKAFEMKHEEIELRKEELKNGEDKDIDKNEYLAYIEKRSKNISNVIDTEYKIIDAGATEELEKKNGSKEILSEEEDEKTDGYGKSEEVDKKENDGDRDIGEEALLK
jgi:hypothetical protein